MSFDRAAVKERIRKFDFAGLFTQELGWDRHKGSLTAHLSDHDVVLNAVAEKRGFAVWHCPTLPDQKLPDSAIRRRIERELTKAAHEHILIFTDAAKSMQVWQWVRREAGKPTRVRETVWTKDQSGELLVQKLERLFVSLDEEERLTLPDVTSRAAGNVDERVTKRFYEEFHKQHAVFLKFITGIPNQGDHEWYASVMLNRLMFLYFIQRKGFLDGDPEYLRNRLQKTKADHGKDKFYNFYRYFLLKLFHGGLNTKPPRKADLEKLIGRVPYLNGGIFDVHQLEGSKVEGGYGPDIEIPDAAFEQLFDFLDFADKARGIRWAWHLDERPLRADNEINPDVLGYIFEKYINQKQMGAYYTKEDITDYIGKNTILPFVFGSARNRCKSAFDGANSVWTHLQQEPDRYIYPAVRHGISWDYQARHPNLGEPLDKPRELPSEVAKGIDTKKPNLLERRKAWNKPAPLEFGLPTETWRETVARRQRCEELQRKLAEGDVRDINDFITLNLDIRRFAQDVISRCDSPDLLAALWHSLAGRPSRKSDERPQPGVTILDPTCGSGAFLFAALNILEPLYEACLDRMEGLLADARVAKGPDWKPPLYSHLAEFERVLSSVADHPNERYFIYKTIILHNLYGVDIMEEAVEICKLRLFLKLAAQVEPDSTHKNFGIEPLPDIDFNIRAGNTLVGYATAEEVRKCMTQFGDGQMRLGVDDELNSYSRFVEKVEQAAEAFVLFRRMQTEGRMESSDFAAAKMQLRERLANLEAQLNRYLATDYGIEVDEASVGNPKSAFRMWLRSHQPFHWFVEFFGILTAGGFDVVIGNPPYVEYSKVRSDYTLPAHYTTLPCGNIYTCIVERSFALAERIGRIGLIVPLSLVCTSRTEELREVIYGYASWISSYDMRPSSLFEGVAQRLSILIGQKQERNESPLFTGGYRRWSAEERPVLIPLTQYVRHEVRFPKAPVPKLGAAIEGRVLPKISAPSLEVYSRDNGPVMYIHRIVRYFVKALDFVPVFRDGRGKTGKSDDYKEFHFVPSEQPQIAALLSSTLFYWFWRSHSDGFHCGYNDVLRLPFRPVQDADCRKALARLLAKLMKELRDTSALKKIKTKAGKITYQEFHPGATKPILDDIDAVLAEHYGFAEEELDFIVNYDIKYRLGRDAGEEE